MVWKIVNNTDPGDATHFGGDDRDKVSNLFNGVLNVDPVNMNTNFTFRDDKLRLRNPANTFSLIFKTPIITADRNVSFPVLGADDEFTFNAATQTLLNKTLTTPTIGSFVNATHDHLAAAGGGLITKAALSDFAHQADHQSGGGDALTGLLDATARTSVSRNSAADVGARRTLNFIEGSNITLTIVDDAAGEEVDITIASSAGAGSPLTTIGDIFGFDTGDARIPVGTNEFVLMADSGEALGVKYALIADANIASHTSTKITITAKGQLNSSIVYTDQTNSFGAFDQIFLDDRLQISNPANTFQYIFSTAAILADITISLPLLAGPDVLVFEGFAATLANKTLTTPTIAAAEFGNMNHTHLGGTTGGQITEASISDLQSYLLDITGENIGDLSDVTNSVTTTRFALMHNGAGVLVSRAIEEADISDLQSYLLNITGEPIGDLSDVTITSLAGLELLQRNAGNTAWINQTIAEAGIAAVSHSHLAGDLPSTIVYDDQVNTYGDGLKQTFNPDSTNAGINVGQEAGEPSSPVIGDIVYDSAAGQFKGYDGAWINLGAGAGGGEANDLQSIGGGTTLTATPSKSGVLLQTVTIATTTPLTHSLSTNLLTFDINDLVDADIAAGAAIVTSKLADSALFVLNNQANTYTGGGTQDFAGADLINIEDILLNETASVRTITLQRAETLADNTDIGVINFNAFDGAAAVDTYAQIRGVMGADGAAIEDGDLFLSVLHNGALTDFLKIGDDNTNTGIGILTEIINHNRVGDPLSYVQARGEILTDGSVIGSISWQAFSDTSATIIYADMIALMVSDVNGAEEGAFAIEVVEGGTEQTTYMSFNVGASGQIQIAKILDLNSQDMINMNIITSNATNPATTGTLQLGNFETLAWRNDANDNNLLLGWNADVFQLTINGVVQLSLSSTIFNLPNAKVQEGGVNISPIGLHDIYLDAGAFVPVDAGAIAARITDTGADQKAFSYIPFPAGSLTFATAKIVLPRTYGLGTITVIIEWTSAIEGSGTVEWDISAVAVGDGEFMDSTNFGTPQNADDTQSTINAIQTSPRTSAITIANTPGDGNVIFIKVARNGAGDSFGQDAQLLGIWVAITTDQAVSS